MFALTCVHMRIVNWSLVKLLLIPLALHTCSCAMPRLAIGIAQWPMTDDEVNFAYDGVVERYMEAMDTYDDLLDAFMAGSDGLGEISEAALRHTLGNSNRWRVRRVKDALTQTIAQPTLWPNSELEAMMLEAAAADTADGQRQINIKEFVKRISAKPQQLQ